MLSVTVTRASIGFLLIYHVMISYFINVMYMVQLKTEVLVSVQQFITFSKKTFMVNMIQIPREFILTFYLVSFISEQWSVK